MWCDNIFWCSIGHFLVFFWITSLTHGNVLKVNEPEPVYLHVGSSDQDSEIGYIKNMKDEGKKGYEHFESFHDKDGDDYGYEKHEAFGYHDSSDGKGDEKKADLKESPIVVQDEAQENQVEEYQKSEDQPIEDQPKEEDQGEHENVGESPTHEDHEDIKNKPETDIENPVEAEDHTEKQEYVKIERSDDNIEETIEEKPEDVENHQELKADPEESSKPEEVEEPTVEDQPTDEKTGEENDQMDEDYVEDDKKKITRNADLEEEDDDESDDDADIQRTYQVTENAEIVEGDQTQQLRYPYGFYTPLINAAILQNPLPVTEATPQSVLNTKVNYGFYSPSGQQKPQPTRSLAPTFSPKLSSIKQSRRNLGSFGYETKIYHHEGTPADKQAIQIKIYDGEITVPATKIKPQEQEKPKNSVDYEDEESGEEEDDSAEYDDEKKQNLKQEADYDESEEDSSSEEESGEEKPSRAYQYKPSSAESRDESNSAEEDDSDDLQSRLVTTSDVDNDAYYWLYVFRSPYSLFCIRSLKKRGFVLEFFTKSECFSGVFLRNFGDKYPWGYPAGDACEIC
uniref:Uncharacterized protein n=1 Tax=Phlebotomus papatasi TaxID=29031 RepID=A0A240SY97_PHLPP